ETFGRVTELETRQAARLQYAVSMLTIHQSPDGSVDQADVSEQLAEVVSPVVRSTDLIAVMPSAPAVRVLLVGGELEDLRSIVQRIIAEVSYHRSGEQRALVVSIGGSSFPATATSSRELLLQADTLAEEVRQEQGHDSTYRLRERPDTS